MQLIRKSFLRKEMCFSTTSGVARSVAARGGVCRCCPWVRGAGGAKHPRARPEAALGVGAGRWSPPPAMGVRGYYPRKNFDIYRSKLCILVHFRLKKYILDYEGIA